MPTLLDPDELVIGDAPLKDGRRFRAENLIVASPKHECGLGKTIELFADRRVATTFREGN